MQRYPNRRLRPTIVVADRDTLSALKDLPTYRPHNPSLSAEALATLEAELEQAQQSEARLERLLAAARDRTTIAEWALHDGVLGAKVEVSAQFGANSDEIQAIGLKKKSDRKRPVRRSTNVTGTP